MALEDKTEIRRNKMERPEFNHLGMDKASPRGSQAVDEDKRFEFKRRLIRIVEEENHSSTTLAAAIHLLENAKPDERGITLAGEV